MVQGGRQRQNGITRRNARYGNGQWTQGVNNAGPSREVWGVGRPVGHVESMAQGPVGWEQWLVVVGGVGRCGEGSGGVNQGSGQKVNGWRTREGVLKVQRWLCAYVRGSK